MGLSNEPAIPVIHTGNPAVGIVICPHITIIGFERYESQINSGYDEWDIHCMQCEKFYTIVYFIGD